MGTNADQAKTLVSNDQAPFFYKLELNLAGIPENRILRLAKECADAEALVKAVSTKRYTESRVRRILANALLRVDQDTFECGIDAAPYYKVLAVKKQRTDILSLFSRAGTLLTGEQEAKESGIPSAVIDAKAHDLYRVATADELADGMILL